MRPVSVTVLRRWCVAAVVAASLLAIAGCSDDDASASTAQCGPVPIAGPSGFCDGAVALSGEIPADMMADPASLDVASARRMVDCFAWESFAALNWAAGADCRGVPDETTGAARDWTSDRVWETFKEPYELFQATDATWDPAGVSFDDAAPSGACDLDDGDKLVRRTFKFPLGEPLLPEDSQAFLPGAVLVDQQGNSVWYEIVINRDIFDYLRDAGLARSGSYSYGGPLGGAGEVDFPSGDTGASGAGSIEIKAAWRELTDADDTSRYFTQDAVVYDGTDCTEQTMGLVGLHIVRKLPSSPKWVWATFEHEDNVPPQGSSGDGRDYNFFSADCAESPPDDCAFQVAIIDEDDECCPNLITFPGPENSINQVTRLTAIQGTAEIGESFRAAFAAADSPFRYFQLVGTQWAKPQGQLPGALRRPCNPSGPWGVPEPAAGEPCYEQIPPVLRNTSMETLIVQTDEQGIQRSTDSCMNCHFAGGVDGSYLWLDAMLNPYEISAD